MSETAPRRLRDLVEIPVDRLRNIGEKRTAALGSMGIDNIFDLLTWYPRRYIDRTKRVDLSDLTVGGEAAVFGEITRIKGRRMKNGKVMVKANVSDDSGSFKVVFFNQGWRENQLPVGVQALFFGKVTDHKGQRQMGNPVGDVIVGASGDERDASRIGRVVPIYPASGKAGLTSWEVGGFIDESLRRTGRMLAPVPEATLRELDLLDRTSSYKGIHLPEEWGVQLTARRRLVFDEFLRLQLLLALRRRRMEESSAGIRHPINLDDLAVTPRALSTSTSS